MEKQRINNETQNKENRRDDDLTDFPVWIGMLDNCRNKMRKEFLQQEFIGYGGSRGLLDYGK